MELREKHAVDTKTVVPLHDELVKVLLDAVVEELGVWKVGAEPQSALVPKGGHVRTEQLLRVGRPPARGAAALPVDHDEPAVLVAPAASKEGAVEGVAVLALRA